MEKIADDIYAFIWHSYRENNCNTYLLDRDGYRILIDPGYYHLSQHWEEGLHKRGLSRRDINLVVVTHAHPDHLEGVALFDGQSKVAIGEGEYTWLKKWAPSFEVDLLLRDGELKVGNIALKVIETPGHSPASICLYYPERKALFTGDVIFRAGLGRTDLPGGDGGKLKESIRKLSHLDVEYLLPGHGEPVIGKKEVAKNFEEVAHYWFQFI